MKLSVVTPVYNGARFIRETIESIAKQSNQDYEHIVIDGLSTDGTMNIVSEYKRIKYVSERDRGQSNAINKGFKLSEGDVLAWQNADDIYFPDAFEIVLNFFKENPSIDIVYGYYQLIGIDGKWVCDVYPMSWSAWMFAHGRFCPPQPTTFWRRAVLEKLGDIDEELHFCMDVDFYSRAVNRGFKVGRIDKMLGKFRIHEQSKTQNVENERKVHDEYKRVLSKNFKYTKIDSVLFEFFQYRAKITKYLKCNFLKKM
jgi:glycosyltransferase involved in cell wall biosynthesis